MTRRMLDSSMWSNENFAALAPRGRLLQIGMINIADDQGRLKAHPLYLAKEIFPYDHIEGVDINKWLNQMQEHGTIALYMVEGKQYAQFLNWWKYQTLSFATPSAYPPPPDWRDRLQFNSKGNRFMSYNWRKPDGTDMPDTCDKDGNPLAKVPSKVPSQVPPQDPSKVPSLEASQVPPQVNKEEDQYKNKEEEERESNNNAAPAARPPSVYSKDHPAIKAYHQLHNRYPTRAQTAEIIRSDPPLEDWRRAIHAWAMAGHNPTNVQGMIDWALDPSRMDGGQRSSAAKYSAADDAARRAQYTQFNNLLAPAPKAVKPS